MTATTTERAELAALLRGLFDKHSTDVDVRRAMESADGYDKELWRLLADEVGLPGLLVPEAYGGAGAGHAELAVVMVELGRALACVPYLSSSVLGVTALVAAADEEACARWLPAVAEGTALLTVAMTGGRRPAEDLPIEATAAGDRWALSGTEPYVLEGPTADAVIVAARHAAGAGLFLVETAATGVGVVARRTSDQTRRFAAITFDKAQARLIADDGLALIGRVVDEASAALAHEQVGGAAAALDMAVDHARTRHQFGRPIGSFQAVKHRCADMLVQVESARSAGWAATRAVEQDSPELPLVALIARKVCAEAYAAVASDNVQVHGGIGFTWEHPAHLHVKRSRGSAVLLGSPQQQHAALIQQVPLLTGEQK